MSTPAQNPTPISMPSRMPPRRPMAFYWHYMKTFRWRFLLVHLTLLAALAAGKVQYYYISHVVDYFQMDDPAAMYRMLINLCIVTGIFLVFMRATGFNLQMTLPKFQARIKQDVFGYLRHHSPAYFANQMAGQLGHKVNDLANQAHQLFHIFLWGFYETALTIIINLAFIMYANQLAGWVFMGVCSLFVGMSIYFGRYLFQPASQYAETKSLVSGYIIDVISNILSVKNFARSKWEQKQLGERLDTEVKAGQYYGMRMEVRRLFLSICLESIILVMAGVGVYLLQTGRITLAEFVLINMLAINTVFFLWEMSKNVLMFFDGIGGMENALSQIAVPLDLTDAPEAETLQIPHGQIEFKDVAFAYNDKGQLFDRLNLTIPAGQKVGLVGHSGAGKSSFVNLLLRYYDVADGIITIDGSDISSVAQESLRRHITLIPQDTSLFHRSLRDNIAYGRPDATEAEIIKAAQQAHAHEFIAALPDGYDTLVGERGVKLSGGQRQRIAIARAFLKNAPILVLDEATSALDSESEQLIQESLATLMEGKTVIAIAHRLSTLRNMDRILVFEEGHLMEDGSPQKLLKQKSSIFAKLWEMQSGNFLNV